MIRLDPRDASILARVAQYVSLPVEKRREILSEASTPEAHQVGQILLGDLKPEALPDDIREEVMETVETLRSWSDESRKVNSYRSAAF